MTRTEIQEITRAMSMTVGQILLDQQEGRGCEMSADEIRLLQNLGTAAVELDLEFQFQTGMTIRDVRADNAVKESFVPDSKLEH